MRGVSVTTVAVEKQYYILCVCVCVFVVLVIQHVKRMRRVILSSVASTALQNFATLSHKRHDFREKVTEHKKKCVFIFSITFVRNVYRSKKNSEGYYHKRT